MALYKYVYDYDYEYCIVFRESNVNPNNERNSYEVSFCALAHFLYCKYI